MKPGKGDPGPQAGEHQSGASQCKREAAFSALARVLGFQGVVPECHLLLLGGVEYAAIRMLPASWETLEDLQRRDPAGARRYLAPHLASGLLHRCAALDFGAGNPDRNPGNVMRPDRGAELALIDAGSALAGADFDPPRDPYAYVPCYLALLAPGGFAQLGRDDQLRALPRAPEAAAQALGAWLAELSLDAASAELVRYGVDPKPTLDRLRKLQVHATSMPPDLAVNAAWTL